MSFTSSPRLRPQRFCLVLTSFLQRPGLQFADVLSEQKIQAAFDEAGANFAQEPDDVYTPPVTLWAFLSQVISKGEMRSCAAAVARVVVLMAALSKEISDNTGTYCRARAKLPERVLQRLTCDVATGCEQIAPPQWLWLGRRHVHLVDGTTLSAPDTAANQQEWPQHGAQQRGLGFPIIRLVVLLSLTTGMVEAARLGRYMGKETGETALLRELLDEVPSGDILVADRYYCSYFMIALLQERRVDVVMRLHQLRTVDFRRGRRLGKVDHIVRWSRPAKPDWMDPATYERMPESIELREIEVAITLRGFRDKSLLVVTTLKDATTYTREAVAELYRNRWDAELDIRTIKITMGIDVERGQTPAMVKKEIWTSLLAYNLIRQSMLESAIVSERRPRELSFTAALQKIAAGWLTSLLFRVDQFAQLVNTHHVDLGTHRVGHRPNRVEPRAIKRRPKAHKLLSEPRDQARCRLLGRAA